MASKILSAALKGISAQIIEVEMAVTSGLRAFNIVGLPDKAIEEAKERVNASIKSIKLSPPINQTKRVLVNLAPADLKKEGSFYDLPIALAFLLASKQAQFDPKGKIILGELALDGRLRPIKGALLFSLLAREREIKEIILPKENAKEAALVNLLDKTPKIKVVGINDLKQAISYLEGRAKIEETKIEISQSGLPIQNFEVDIGWIKGQNYAKRAIEIAAAGGHNVMLQGPPGTGKTLLAKAAASVLPKLSLEEALELTKIYSACGLLPKDRPILSQRPFRAPHHSSSEAALIGGGSPPKPGEITLAHRGILFLDEFPEFHRDVLESLRQPLEEGEITILRAKHSLKFPAKFTLIAAANPCPCGHLNDPEVECTCTVSQIAAYRRKLSSPLMDRIDIFVWVPSLKYEELVSPEKESLSEKIRSNVEKAREIQRERLLKDSSLNGYKKELTQSYTNSEMKIPQIKKYCQVDNKSQTLLKKFVNSGKMSARGYHRALKTARTIADLEGKEHISFDNVSEALMYQNKEDNFI